MSKQNMTTKHDRNAMQAASYPRSKCDTVKVKLTHYCNLESCKGVPGDIVEVPKSLADQWLVSGGCVLCEGDDATPLRAAEDDRSKDAAG